MVKRTSNLLLEKLTPWLSDRIEEPLEIVELATPKANGFSGETVVVHCTTKGKTLGFAIRFENAKANDLFMDADLSRAFRTIAALSATGQVPVPKPIGFEHDTAILGAPFMVTEYIPGRAPPQNPNYNVAGWVSDLEAAERNRLWRAGIETMATVHRLSWQNGFEFLARPDLGPTGLDQILVATRQWYDWSRRDLVHPLVERALERLERERPESSEDAVLWGDAFVHNMLFDNGACSAILDWEIAAIAPPELDLAWWLFFQDYSSRGFDHPLLDGIPRREETIAVYERALGRPVRNLAYFDLLAHVRNAIMAMRSVNRQIGLGSIAPSNQGPINNPPARMLAERLGAPLPDVGADYRAYLDAVIGSKRVAPTINEAG